MRLWAGVSGILLLCPAPCSAGTAQTARANELTVAGLRPGKDSLEKALARYPKGAASGKGESEYSWKDGCRQEQLLVRFASGRIVDQVRVVRPVETEKIECAAPGRSLWRTGRGIALGDSAQRVVLSYGEPDSRSPSTKDGQRLELLYYAFDWAGPDVPQVLEVLCTVGKDGRPGRVVEIMLAASSL
jgi:hypothetical protein